MKVDDGVLGTAFAGLGALMIVSATDMRALAHIPYGPGFFPTIVGAVMVGFGGLLLVRRVVAGTGRVAGSGRDAGSGRGGGLARLDRDPDDPRWWLSPLLFAGAPLVYALAAKALGFLIVMPLILIVLIGHRSGRWASAAALALALTLLLHTLFEQVMRVPLPWGLLEPWAGVLSWR